MRALIRIYHLLLVVKYCAKRMFESKNYRQSDFRILLYHEISQHEVRNFTRQIDSCLKNWTFADPNTLGQVFQEKDSKQIKHLMLTFDDGFSSDFRIAQDVLNPRGIKAIFFVIPEFVNSASNEKQEQFIYNQLYPGVKNRRVPAHLRSMSWEQIKLLSSQGHVIGSHSMSHKNLSQVAREDELRHEIIDSGRVIESFIGKKVEHFAFPFGNLSSLSWSALKIASTNYEYVYSGMRGSNHLQTKRFVLRRETVFPWDPIGFEVAVLAGVADSRFTSSLEVLDEWQDSLTKDVPS
jgi:peptidoglycan/xylan/chitin deacetylase (PgdA/CDA1 family)